MIGAPNEYRRAKKLFDLGRHPTFIGHTMVERNARNGGLIFFVFDGQDVGVRVLNARTAVGLALTIHPDHRGHGLGTAILKYMMLNYVRVLESAVPWYEQRGYCCVGEWIQGRKLRTRVLVREGLFDVAGRVAALNQSRKLRCREVPEAEAAWDGYGRWENAWRGELPVPVVGKGPGR